MISQQILNFIPNTLIQLQNYCYKFYPNEHDRKCINSEKSFLFEGGSKPLDYIYVFKNHGDPLNNIAKHWHYVGLGLSDIYNYSQFCQNFMTGKDVPQLGDIYPPPFSTDERLSGFGFELTFRLKCNSDHDWDINHFPEWPCNILQALAKHVYESQNLINSGENFDWKLPLPAICMSNGDDDDDVDGLTSELNCNTNNWDKESLIKHILTVPDPQLAETETLLGKVKFLQLVGITDNELLLARQWNGKGVSDMMAERIETGGQYLITDMTRTVNINQFYTHDEINLKINLTGSNVAIVNATHKYSSMKPIWYKDVEDNLNTNRPYTDDENHHDNQEEEPLRCPSRQSRISYESETALKISNAEHAETRYYDNIYLLLPLKSAKLLPIALERRLAYEKHFTFKNVRGDLCITLVPESMTAKSMVSPNQPYVRHGVWLHIYISEELRSKMLESIGNDFHEGSQTNLPKNYSWPDYKFYITVVREVSDSRGRP